MASAEPDPLILSGKCMHKESERQCLSTQQAALESSSLVSSIPSSIWCTSKKAKTMVTKAGTMLSKASRAVKKLTKHKASDQSDNMAASTNQASSGTVSWMNTDNSSLPSLKECGQDNDDEDDDANANGNQGNNGDHDDPPIDVPEVMEEAHLGNVLAIISVITC
ncbi:hypothetical protein EDD85DRAFT_961039 [Armillaria nabsnona]|nr:hypothetical protein EDD85DRAFT_961039 [Armillaria nabsnona]